MLSEHVSTAPFPGHSHMEYDANTNQLQLPRSGMGFVTVRGLQNIENDLEDAIVPFISGTSSDGAPKER